MHNTSLYLAKNVNTLDAVQRKFSGIHPEWVDCLMSKVGQHWNLEEGQLA